MAAVEINISVRSLVEFMLRSGDIDTMSGTDPLTLNAMLQGGRVHRKIQKESGPDYRAEVPLKLSTVVDDDLVINVSGRADGIISESEIGSGPDGVLGLRDIITIDEIKGTYRSLRHITEPVPVHLAQAKCYACFYVLSRIADSASGDIIHISSRVSGDSEKNSNKNSSGFWAACGTDKSGADAGIDLYVQLTYVNMKSGEIRRFKARQDIEELISWYKELIRNYSVWVRAHARWEERRNRSIQELHFPFEYRPGQKKMVSGVYQTILRKKRLFAMAPTGTGKTLGALYPAIQSLGAGLADRIFYLTAKNTTGTAADNALQMLRGRCRDNIEIDLPDPSVQNDSHTVSGDRSAQQTEPDIHDGRSPENGLMIKTVFITARDRICVLETPHCSPLFCERAKGHYDRVNEALFSLLDNEDRIDRETVSRYAQKYNVCPYALGMDAAEWADIIVCDYNYIFDPDAGSDRFLADGSHESVYLIDEAHNLVERARRMYGAGLSLSDLGEAAKVLKGLDRGLSSGISSCRKIMRKMRDEKTETDGSIRDDNKVTGIWNGECRILNDTDTGTLITALESLLETMEDVLRREMDPERREGLVQAYFTVRKFVRAGRRRSDGYVTYSITKGRHFEINICCADPSADIGKRLEGARAAVFFSATLTPVKYYKEMLSDTPDEDYDLYTGSPFDRRRRLLLAAGDVSSAYKRRGPDEYSTIASYIYSIIRARRGNYMVFFSSYAMMEDVYDVFSGKYMRVAGHGIKILRQRPDMSDSDRQEFLNSFQNDGTEAVTGMCVLGGIFAEGIDLKEEQLIGVIIVGTGIPQISPERDILKMYFDAERGRGFDYAYLYPGMNKVQQAAGRLIRTQSDKGVIALLDERFLSSRYREFFSGEWSDCVRTDSESVLSLVEEFWTSFLESP